MRGWWAVGCSRCRTLRKEDIFRTAPWMRPYYSSPKPKVTDASMFHLLLKAPNKYLPDLTLWVMTEHPAWQIMLSDTFKLHIFDATCRIHFWGQQPVPSPPMNRFIILQDCGHLDYAMLRIRRAKQAIKRTANKANAVLPKITTCLKAFLENVYLYKIQKEETVCRYPCQVSQRQLGANAKPIQIHANLL